MLEATPRALVWPLNEALQSCDWDQLLKDLRDLHTKLTVLLPWKLTEGAPQKDRRGPKKGVPSTRQCACRHVMLICRDVAVFRVQSSERPV